MYGGDYEPMSCQVTKVFYEAKGPSWLCTSRAEMSEWMIKARGNTHYYQIDYWINQFKLIQIEALCDSNGQN